MVIKTIAVLENPIKDLESRLPKGHNIDTDAPIVLLVGQNGSGKSLFLRLLRTSYNYNDYFDKAHASKVLEHHNLPSLSKDCMFEEGMPAIAKANRVISEWDEARMQYYVDRYNISGTPVIQEVSFRTPRTFSFENKNETRHYVNTKEFGVLLQQIKEFTKLDTDQNRWVFLRPQSDDPNYLLYFVPLSQGASDGQAKTASHRTTTHFDYIECSHMVNRDLSTGQILMVELERLYNRIHTFFKENKIASCMEDANVESMRFIAAMRIISEKYGNLTCNEAKAAMAEEWNESYEHYEQINKEHMGRANLIVFMDEPTRSLSYDNLYAFKKNLLQLTEQYKGKIQFLIATNDPVLIEKTPAKYINFYKSPAESTNNINLDSVSN